MPSFLSAAGSFLAGLLGITAMIERWQAKRQGEQVQAAKDTAATLGTVEAERDAAERAPTAEEAAREGRF